MQSTCPTGGPQSYGTAKRGPFTSATPDRPSIGSTQLALELLHVILRLAATLSRAPGLAVPTLILRKLVVPAREHADRVDTRVLHVVARIRQRASPVDWSPSSMIVLVECHALDVCGRDGHGEASECLDAPVLLVYGCRSALSQPLVTKLTLELLHVILQLDNFALQMLLLVYQRRNVRRDAITGTWFGCLLTHRHRPYLLLLLVSHGDDVLPAVPRATYSHPPLLHSTTPELPTSVGEAPPSETVINEGAEYAAEFTDDEDDTELTLGGYDIPIIARPLWDHNTPAIRHPHHARGHRGTIRQRSVSRPLAAHRMDPLEQQPQAVFLDEQWARYCIPQMACMTRRILTSPIADLPGQHVARCHQVWHIDALGRDEEAIRQRILVTSAYGAFACHSFESDTPQTTLTPASASPSASP
ncbi:hypothetical protein EVG20_g4258 [Dentipellis fragilis]|uniref:Uncharacterized protein n=1 Tax=Dentipellis fragilis TaxID=205917 RepID=A0A4Y9YYZ0_9AGAM|nr:hypothetical protein EVG20_g4258 [Dentipellis fragilis]